MRPWRLQDRGDRGRDRFFVADVAGVTLTPCRRPRRSRRRPCASLSGLRPTSATRGAERGQLVRGAAADAAAAAGDDDHLAGEQARRGKSTGMPRAVCPPGQSRERGQTPCLDIQF